MMVAVALRSFVGWLVAEFNIALLCFFLCFVGYRRKSADWAFDSAARGRARGLPRSASWPVEKKNNLSGFWTVVGVA